VLADGGVVRAPRVVLFDEGAEGLLLAVDPDLRYLGRPM
jgi:hypothetical protein